MNRSDRIAAPAGLPLHESADRDADNVPSDRVREYAEAMHASDCGCDDVHPWHVTLARACVAVEERHTAELEAENSHNEWACKENQRLLREAIDRAEKAEATIARVEALHVEGHGEYGPICAEDGFDWPCSTARALRGPEPTDEPSPTYATDHGFTPGRFTPDACRVMLARHPCRYGKDEHDPTKPAEDIDAFGYRRRGPEPTEATSNEDAPRLDVGADAPTSVGAEQTDAP